MLLYIVIVANTEPTLAILYQRSVHVPDNNNRHNRSFSGVVVCCAIWPCARVYMYLVYGVCVCLYMWNVNAVVTALGASETFQG